MLLMAQEVGDTPEIPLEYTPTQPSVPFGPDGRGSSASVPVPPPVSPMSPASPVSSPAPFPASAPPAASVPVAAPADPAARSRSGRGGRHRAVLMAAAAVVALAGVAAGVVALLDNGGGDGGAALGGHTSQSADKGSSRSPSAPEKAPQRPVKDSEPTASPSDRIPEGYELVEDPLGFSLAVPEGFAREYKAPRVYYNSPGMEFRIGIHIQEQSPEGPLGLSREADAKGPRNYPGYRSGQVIETEHNGRPAALWAFIWNGSADDGGSRQTYDLSWNENGKMYDLWLSAPWVRNPWASGISTPPPPRSRAPARRTERRRNGFVTSAHRASTAVPPPGNDGRMTNDGGRANEPTSYSLRPPHAPAAPVPGPQPPPEAPGAHEAPQTSQGPQAAQSSQGPQGPQPPQEPRQPGQEAGAAGPSRGAYEPTRFSDPRGGPQPPAGQPPAEEAPAGQPPAGQPPAEEAPAGQPPAEEAPAGQPPAEDRPGARQSAPAPPPPPRTRAAGGSSAAAISSSPASATAVWAPYGGRTTRSWTATSRSRSRASPTISPSASGRPSISGWSARHAPRRGSTTPPSSPSTTWWSRTAALGS
ncbi:hypothetical protein SVIO_051000 [Streptomyces violaceusniger]|uniref:Uncharacterized protein n=1 Tax=Streptomyces violaceusniger TaxID=68280 RepID=A0A4D4L743_STRVO|nr:hypothetical protein SVIO_051000 [Streptomyces violaceusniger]